MYPTGKAPFMGSWFWLNGGVLQPSIPLRNSFLFLQNEFANYSMQISTLFG